MSDFRKYLDGYTYAYEEVKDIDNGYEFTNSDKFVLENEVRNTLDSIENSVNLIKDSLEGIKGLSEIDNIYDMIKNLSSRLY